MIVPKIYGIGYGRTGTQSLTQALRILGFNAAHLDLDFVGADLRDDLTLNSSIFFKYDALLDGVVPLWYREWWRPEDKFILTVRDVNNWYKSYAANIKARRNFPRILRKMIKALYGTVYTHEPTMKYAFLKHEIDVKNFFRDKKNLLIMDITEGDGWEKLAPFVGRAIPDKPFPWLGRLVTKKEEKK